METSGTQLIVIVGQDLLAGVKMTTKVPRLARIVTSQAYEDRARPRREEC